MKAFKHAIFGTPQTVISDEKRYLTRSLSKPRGRDKNTNAGNWSARSQVAPRDDGRHIDGESGDDDRGYFDDYNMSSKRPSSPSKPNGILMTPGTGPVRRKTVSFGTHVPAEELGLEVRSDLTRAKNGLSTELPGKFPSPWTSKLANDTSARPFTSGGQPSETDARDLHTNHALPPKFPSSKSRDDTDITLDFETPRSESGRYWQAQYRSYAEKSAYEVRRLLQKQQAAKQYAKKKDQEAMEMATKLKDERRRHRLRERALESQLKDQREQLKQHGAEIQSYTRQIATLKKRVEGLQQQQKKQAQQQQYRSSSGRGLRRAHSSTGGRGSGSGYGSGLGSEERFSGTSASAAAGNGSKTSSFASDSFRMSSSTSSQNREFDKQDSVTGKVASVDASKLPPGGVMKATATLAELMDDDPQLSFLHPPSDAENTSPRRFSRKGSRSENVLKPLDATIESRKEDQSSQINSTRNSRDSGLLRTRPCSSSRGEKSDVVTAKDATPMTVTKSTSDVAAVVRARPVTAILRPKGGDAQRAISTSPDPWLISTSSQGATLSLPNLSEPVLGHRIQADDHLEQLNKQQRPDSPTMPSPTPETQRRSRCYSTSSSSVDSAGDENGDGDNNDDNSNIIDEADPPSLHIPSPRRERPSSRLLIDSKNRALDSRDTSRNGISRSTTTTTTSGSGSSAYANASNPYFHELDSRIDTLGDDVEYHDDMNAYYPRPAGSASTDASKQQRQLPSRGRTTNATGRSQDDNPKEASTSTPKSIPIVIQSTPSMAIPPPSSSRAATAAVSPPPTPPTTTISRSTSKKKRFFSSERMAAAKERLEARRREKSTLGKG